MMNDLLLQLREEIEYGEEDAQFVPESEPNVLFNQLKTILFNRYNFVEDKWFRILLKYYPNGGITIGYRLIGSDSFVLDLCYKDNRDKSRGYGYKETSHKISSEQDMVDFLHNVDGMIQKLS